MLDVLFVAIPLVFFMLALAYVAACDRLSGSVKTPAERRQS